MTSLPGSTYDSASLFYASATHRTPPSFPTRRSSDLPERELPRTIGSLIRIASMDDYDQLVTALRDEGMIRARISIDDIPTRLYRRQRVMVLRYRDAGHYIAAFPPYSSTTDAALSRTG